MLPYEDRTFLSRRPRTSASSGCLIAQASNSMADIPYYGVFVDPTVLRSLLNDVAELTGEHVILVAISLGFAILIGVGLGIAGTRHAQLRRVSVAVASVLQAIARLAVFGVLGPVPQKGAIGIRRTIVCHSVYSLRL